MTKVNNLDVNGDAVHHKELAASYTIQGAVYDLASVVVAVQNGQSDADWNARTVADRLAAIKDYLTQVDATVVNPGDGSVAGSSWGDGQAGGVITDADGKVIGKEGDVAPGDKPSESEVTGDGEDDVPVEMQLANAKLDLDNANKRIADLEDEVQRHVDDAAQRDGVSRSEVTDGSAGVQADDATTTKPTLHGSIRDLPKPY